MSAHEEPLQWHEGESIYSLNRRVLMRVLKSNGGNRSRAAHVLGISIRTVRNWCNDLQDQGISVPDNQIQKAQKKRHHWIWPQRLDQENLSTKEGA